MYVEFHVAKEDSILHNGQVGVEVDDHVHRLDVDAPGEEVRGNQTPASSLTEVVEHSIPVGLVHPRVDEEA